MAMTSGWSAEESLVFAAETPTTRGCRPSSDRTWIVEPGVPRSTGLGLVTDPPFFARTLAASRITRDQSINPGSRVRPAPLQHRVVQPTPQPGRGPLPEPGDVSLPP
jgi:hypothetical protein